MKKIPLIFCASLLFLAKGSFAESTLAMLAEAKPKEVYIGDPIHFQVTLTFSSGVTPSPLSEKINWGNFEMRDFRSSPPESSQGDKIVQRHEFALITFSTGTQLIPSLTFYFQLPDGQQAQAVTETTAILVKSLLQEKGDQGKLMPPKGFFDIPSYAWIFFLILLLLLVGLGIFVYKRIKRKKLEATGGIPEGPKKSPQEVAWDMLDELETADFVAQGKIKEFYIQLTQILRIYLENQFQMSALEKTTSELLSDIRRLNLSHDLSALLRLFLENGDLVKFAKLIPAENEIDEDLQRIKKFVSQTTPEVVPKKKQEIPV